MCSRSHSVTRFQTRMTKSGVAEGGADGGAPAQEPELRAGEPGDPRTSPPPQREAHPLRLVRDRRGGARREIALEGAQVPVDAQGAPPLRRGEGEEVAVPAEAGVLTEPLDGAGDEVDHDLRRLTPRTGRGPRRLRRAAHRFGSPTRGRAPAVSGGPRRRHGAARLD